MINTHHKKIKTFQPEKLTNEDLLDLLERIGRSLVGGAQLDPRKYYQVGKILLDVYDKKVERGELSEDEIHEILSAQGFDLGNPEGGD